MKGKLEDHIKNIGDGLNTESPDVNYLWEGIKDEMARKKKKRNQLFSAAALIIIMISIGSYYIFQNSNNDANEINFILSDYTEELANEEKLLMGLITDKIEVINSYQVDKNEYHDFYNELDLLEELNIECINDLDEIGYSPQMVKAIIRYYEQKIRILEKLLYEIQKREDHEKSLSFKKQPAV